MANHADILRARKCVDRYRRLGLVPLPGHTARKGPALPKYADYFGKAAVPESVYRDWSSPNICLMTGTQTPGTTKIVVVDCDSGWADKTWKEMLEYYKQDYSHTWTVRTGGGGSQWYWRLPDDLAECPSGLLWGVWDTWGSIVNGQPRPGWSKHIEIRLLGDRRLATAPPSLHVETCLRYRFIANRDPISFPLPQLAPQWLLSMPRLVAPKIQSVSTPKPRGRPLAPFGRYNGSKSKRDDVLAAISDKVALAKEWGLEVVRDEPNPNGWVCCRAFNREDRTPSAMLHVETGVYQDRLDMATLSLFDLGFQLRPDHFRSWLDCLEWCAQVYISSRNGGRVENFQQ